MRWQIGKFWQIRAHKRAKAPSQETAQLTCLAIHLSSASSEARDFPSHGAAMTRRTLTKKKTPSTVNIEAKMEEESWRANNFIVMRVFTAANTVTTNQKTWGLAGNRPKFSLIAMPFGHFSSEESLNRDHGGCLQEEYHLVGHHHHRAFIYIRPGAQACRCGGDRSARDCSIVWLLVGVDMV